MSTAPNSILFEVLANILTKKSEKIYFSHISDELRWKTYTNYMTLRYLTMSTDERVRNVVLDNYLKLERMPSKAQYKWLLKNIPLQKSTFIKYIR